MAFPFGSSSFSFSSYPASQQPGPPNHRTPTTASDHSPIFSVPSNAYSNDPSSSSTTTAPRRAPRGLQRPGSNRLNGPLHPPNRPPPSSNPYASSSSNSTPNVAFGSAVPSRSSSDLEPAKKRGWVPKPVGIGIGVSVEGGVGAGSSRPSHSMPVSTVPSSNNFNYGSDTNQQHRTSASSIFPPQRSSINPLPPSTSNLSATAVLDTPSSYVRQVPDSTRIEDEERESRISVFDEPPNKKRKVMTYGVTDLAGDVTNKVGQAAGKVLSTALDAAIFTTAVGFAAYQLWRGRGIPMSEESSNTVNSREAIEPPSPEEPRSSEDKSPGPPPYEFEGDFMPHPSTLQTAPPPEPVQVIRKVRHVHISRTRDRPRAYASHRPRNPASTTQQQQQQQQQAPTLTTFSPTLSHSIPMPMPISGPEPISGVMEGGGTADGQADGEDEDMFSEFESRLKNLIASGTEALQRRPTDGEVDVAMAIEGDEYAQVTPKHGLAGGSGFGTPSSDRGAGTRFSGSTKASPPTQRRSSSYMLPSGRKHQSRPSIGGNGTGAVGVSRTLSAQGGFNSSQQQRPSAHRTPTSGSSFSASSDVGVASTATRSRQGSVQGQGSSLDRTAAFRY